MIAVTIECRCNEYSVLGDGVVLEGCCGESGGGAET